MCLVAVLLTISSRTVIAAQSLRYCKSIKHDYQPGSCWPSPPQSNASYSYGAPGPPALGWGSVVNYHYVILLWSVLASTYALDHRHHLLPAIKYMFYGYYYFPKQYFVALPAAYAM